MDHLLLPMLVRETVTTWDYVDRLLLTAWSLDPASGTTSYHGRVRIIISRGTLRIHECMLWQTPPFPVPLQVLLGMFWTAPVGSQPGAQGATEGEGSASEEVTSDGSSTLTIPAAVMEDSSCVEIPPPAPVLATSSTTPTLDFILLSSDSDPDFGPEEDEATSRARVPSESSCLVCGEHPCRCPP
ncbi:hypothetical protein P8452_71133 [Trifolium repens]|nr:hypothetical protein P8452_71133 [Trifolium repens]